jgi:hypothetical protein
MLRTAFRSNETYCVYVDFHSRVDNRMYCVILVASLTLYQPYFHTALQPVQKGYCY